MDGLMEDVKNLLLLSKLKVAIVTFSKLVWNKMFKHPYHRNGTYTIHYKLF